MAGAGGGRCEVFKGQQEGWGCGGGGVAACQDGGTHRALSEGAGRAPSTGAESGRTEGIKKGRRKSGGGLAGEEMEARRDAGGGRLFGAARKEICCLCWTGLEAGERKEKESAAIEVEVVEVEEQEEGGLVSEAFLEDGVTCLSCECHKPDWI